MKYKPLTLWTWDGIKQNYMSITRTVKPFKADVLKYTDSIGYGMYMEISTNMDLDFNDGGLVHNVPDHKNNELKDLTGFFWCMQMFKIANKDDKRHHYALVDLTFGRGDSFKFKESPRKKKTTRSPFMFALQNANSDTMSLFIDGLKPGENVQYLPRIDDSKTNVLWKSGDGSEFINRDEFISELQRLSLRHFTDTNASKRWGSNLFNPLSWYLTPLPLFRMEQQFDVMLDDFELEELADVIETPQCTAIRQFSYGSWVFTDSTGKTNILKNDQRLSFYTQYIDIYGKIQDAYVPEVFPQEMYGMPIFFTSPSQNDDATGTLPPPKTGSVKFIEVDYEDVAELGFYDFSSQLSSSAAIDGSKSYKVNRILDVNQSVAVNYKRYNVSEVDYINEVSVIGRLTGVI